VKRLAELRAFVREAASLVARDATVAQFEIYCASAEHRIARLNYTSDIPCRGVEEFKSHDADGFQLRIVARDNPHRAGIASEGGDLSLDAVGRALTRAHQTAVVDPHFPGLPARATAPPTARTPAGLGRADDRMVAQCAWSILGGALETFAAGAPARPSAPGLVIGGDLSVIRDRIALANSNFGDVRADEAARFTSSVTVLVESLDAKGTATALGSSVAAMRRAAASLGRDAMARAFALPAGVRPPSGGYRIVLGPQPVAEILNYMVMGSLTTGSFFAASSAYQGRFGARVMDRRLSLFDDPHHRDGVVHRTMTCEGLAARRTDLIRAGRLSGLMSNFYDGHRLATDAHRAEKLGPDAPSAARFAPGSGYRLGESGARRYDASPGTAGTNVVMRARAGVSDASLLAAVGDGIYVGRIWYTYPINGQRAGDFTCTVSGDSFMIRGGKRAEALAPNALRINANLREVFEAPSAVGARSHPATVWGSPEAYYVPAIAVDRLELQAIGTPQ
jgi:PmbA protein